MEEYRELVFVTAPIMQQSSLVLTGWVRNRYDGTVEMEIQGKRMCIDALLCALEQNDYVQIDDMDTRMLAVEAEERSFRILD